LNQQSHLPFPPPPFCHRSLSFLFDRQGVLTIPILTATFSSSALWFFLDSHLDLENSILPSLVISPDLPFFPSGNPFVPYIQLVRFLFLILYWPRFFFLLSRNFVVSEASISIIPFFFFPPQPFFQPLRHHSFPTLSAGVVVSSCLVALFFTPHYNVLFSFFHPSDSPPPSLRQLDDRPRPSIVPCLFSKSAIISFARLFRYRSPLPQSSFFLFSVCLLCWATYDGFALLAAPRFIPTVFFLSPSQLRTS